MAVVTKTADRTTDDLGLVAAVRAGDDRAFEVLFERYQGTITAYVRGMVRDHGRAEDVTQEVFIAALRRMRETDREIAFKPWIYAIAKNACIDAFRRARDVHEVSIDAGDALGPADQGRLAAPGLAADAVDAKLAIDDLCGAFGALSQTHHDILVMREFDGLSYREIGERLDMSRAAVESTLFRARRRLGEEYGEIASGERCVRVRAIVDSRADRAAGLRDRRRMARHLSHCQPCRRYAYLAGVDLGMVPAPKSAGAKVAALLPLPAFMRRRPKLDDTGQLLGAGHGVPVLQGWPTVVGGLDPAAVSGWSKAVATAATVAVAGLGAGAAVQAPDTLRDLVSRGQSIVGLGHHRDSAEAVHAPALSGGRSLAIAARTARRRTAADVAQLRLMAAPRRTTTDRASGPSAAVAPSHGRSDGVPGRRPVEVLGSTLPAGRPDAPTTPGADAPAAKRLAPRLLGGGSAPKPAADIGASGEPLTPVMGIVKGGMAPHGVTTQAPEGAAREDADVSTAHDPSTITGAAATADGSEASTHQDGAHGGLRPSIVGGLVGTVPSARSR